MSSCSICAAPKSKQENGCCVNQLGCDRRRIQNRIREDAKRGGRQCLRTRGLRTIVFCVMRHGHEGLHTNGGKEWASKEETVMGRLFASVLRPAVRELEDSQ